MALITEIFSNRVYELVRDRIGEILATELPYQATGNADPDLNAEIYIERFVPVADEETPVVNVSFAEGDMEMKTLVSRDGNYTFFIDCYTTAKATAAETKSDKKSTLKLHRLTGVVAAILDHYKYNTLAFQAPFIEHTEVKNIKIAAPKNSTDASMLTMSRIEFTVRVPESYQKMTPVSIDGYTTQALLGETALGYTYGTATMTPPAPICEGVDIRLNGIEIVIAESGAVVDLPVQDSNGLVVGAWNGAEFVVPPAGGGDATETIKDSAGTVLYIDTIPSGGSNERIISDGTITNSNGSINIPILAEGTEVLPDVNNVDSDGTIVPTPSGVAFVASACAPPLTSIAYVRDHWTINEGTGNLNGDLKWYIDNTDVFTTYNVNGIAPILDPSDTSKLLTNNFYGNLDRVTNDKGNQNYTDVGGGLTSDGATADYAIDNFTGKGILLNSVHSGTQNWNDSFVTAQSTTLTAYDGSVYGSDDYGQFTMLTRKSVNHICVGDSLTTIFDGIQNWDDSFHWIMSSLDATRIFFWRQNQNTESGTRFNNFSNTSVNAGIDLILERNHF